jgi:hypothetical protein
MSVPVAYGAAMGELMVMSVMLALTAWACSRAFRMTVRA